MKALGRRTVLWSMILPAAVGLAAGVGGFTFWYGHGMSYLTNDPQACANCHIMRGQYDAWLQGSHRSTAVCNDCHTPKGAIRKYLVKADNGFWHSFAFTTGAFREPIQIKPRNRAVTEKRCRGCHEAVVAMIDGDDAGGEHLACVRCHADVGHRH